MMEAMWERIGCRTGYLNELWNGAMLKDGKFVDDGNGRGNQLGDWVGGVKPKYEPGGLSADAPRRKWFMEVEFESCVVIL